MNSDSLYAQAHEDEDRIDTGEPGLSAATGFRMLGGSAGKGGLTFFRIDGRARFV